MKRQLLYLGLFAVLYMCAGAKTFIAQAHAFEREELAASSQAPSEAVYIVQVRFPGSTMVTEAIVSEDVYRKITAAAAAHQRVYVMIQPDSFAALRHLAQFQKSLRAAPRPSTWQQLDI